MAPVIQVLSIGLTSDISTLDSLSEFFLLYKNVQIVSISWQRYILERCKSIKICYLPS